LAGLAGSCLGLLLPCSGLLGLLWLDESCLIK
jgi:hypothetical protein